MGMKKSTYLNSGFDVELTKENLLENSLTEDT